MIQTTPSKGKTTREWRVKKMCENCPFQKSGPGLHLRKSLAPGRWRGILRGLRNEENFFCHKTTNSDDFDDETGDYFGVGLICAGALAYQEQHSPFGKSQYVQICERLDARAAQATNQPGEHHETTLTIRAKRSR